MRAMCASTHEALAWSGVGREALRHDDSARARALDVSEGFASRSSTVSALHSRGACDREGLRSFIAWVRCARFATAVDECTRRTHVASRRVNVTSGDLRGWSTLLASSLTSCRGSARSREAKNARFSSQAGKFCLGASTEFLPRQGLGEVFQIFAPRDGLRVARGTGVQMMSGSTP